MSEKEVMRILAKARFKFRSDTFTNWATKNPILLSGEFGVVTGLNEVGDGKENKIQKVKIGDGVNAWNELNWWYGSESSSDSIVVDHTYNPESKNAQSGKAVAEVVEILEEIMTNKEQYIFEVLRENYVSKEQLDNAIGQALEGDY